jgi:S1-C subfamily serine protease
MAVFVSVAAVAAQPPQVKPSKAAEPTKAAPAAGADVDFAAGLRVIRNIEGAFHRAIAKAEPSICSVYLISNSDAGVDHGPRRGFMREERADDRRSTNFSPISVGSGIVVKSDPDKAKVLTAFHVVRAALREGSKPRITVVTADDRQYDGTLIAGDSRSDLAVVEIETDRLVPAISLGKGEDLVRGQFVLAVGNLFGVSIKDGVTSASWGIVSNIRRRQGPGLISDDRDILLGNREPDPPLYSYGTLIQTDCRLNMGISGGGLIDVEGRLVGMTVALSAANGLETPGGFAVPVDEFFRRCVTVMSEGREVEFGYLGISAPFRESVSVSPDQPPRFGLKVNRTTPYLPAVREGKLREGDVILTMEGQKVEDFSDLMIMVGGKPVGYRLDTEVFRDGQVIRLSLPLAKFPVQGTVHATVKRPSAHGIRVDHLSIFSRSSIGFGRNRQIDDPGSGVAVREVEPGSLADKRGVKPEWVITSVNDTPVSDPDTFDRVMAGLKLPIRLTLTGGGETVVLEDDKPAPGKSRKTDDRPAPSSGGPGPARNP